MNTLRKNSLICPVSPGSLIVDTELISGTPQSILEGSPLNMPLLRQTINATFKMRKVDCSGRQKDDASEKMDLDPEVVNI